MPLVDSHGRVHDDLRISVTDRCNLRCAYCMPSEPVWYARSEILSFEEIVRLSRIFARDGVRKIRVTGGEPLLRKDLVGLVGMLAAVPGIEEISLTTNGLALDRLAEGLAVAGLTRVNVSIDTLRRDRFRALTGRDVLDRVLEGLGVAERVGLHPIKINTVLLRGVNDDEVEDLVGVGRERGWEWRFIEFMPLENDGSWNPSRVVSGAEVRRRITTRWPLAPDPTGDAGAPAARFVFLDGKGAVGFVDTVTAPFCRSCSRLRLTSDGQFRVCLHDRREWDLKGPLRSGAEDDDLTTIIRDAVAVKGRGGALEILEGRYLRAAGRTMHQIGG